MPASGIPKGLEALMGTLFETLSLQGWQIFQDKYENVILKIRFTDHNGGLPDDVTPCSYKKKSNTQQNRDRKRAKDFKRKVGDYGIKTRSMTKSVEKPRSTMLVDNIVSDSQPLLQFNDSQNHNISDMEISVSSCHHTECNDLSTEPAYDHELGLDISHASVVANENNGVPQSFSPLLQMEQEPLLPTFQGDKISEKEETTLDSESDSIVSSNHDEAVNCDTLDLNLIYENLKRLSAGYDQMSISLKKIDDHLDINNDT